MRVWCDSKSQSTARYSRISRRISGNFLKGLHITNFSFFFPPRFCDVAEVAIIHKMIYSDLSTYGFRYESRNRQTNRILLYILGYLLELIIKIWRFECYFFLEIWGVWAIFPMKYLAKFLSTRKDLNLFSMRGSFAASITA